MTLTKNDLSRVIIYALFDLPELPAADHPQVIRRSRLKKTELEYQHRLAMDALEGRIK